VSSVGDSEGARRLSRTIRNGAGELDNVERMFRRALDRSESRGGAFALAQVLFRGTQIASVNRVEQQMRDLALPIQRHAEWVDSTEDELSDLERRIRQWAATNPESDDPTVSGPDASLIRYYPAPLSFEWRDLASRLRAYGAWF